MFTDILSYLGLVSDHVLIDIIFVSFLATAGYFVQIPKVSLESVLLHFSYKTYFVEELFFLFQLLIVNNFVHFKLKFIRKGGNYTNK